jgi:hypothetical protein
LKCPLDLHNLGPLGKKLAIGGKALPIRVHHHVIGHDHFQLSFGLTDRDILPVFVSSEIRNASLPNFSVYLSCAAMAMPPKTASITAWFTFYPALIDRLRLQSASSRV